MNSLFPLLQLNLYHCKLLHRLHRRRTWPVPTQAWCRISSRGLPRYAWYGGSAVVTASVIAFVAFFVLPGKNPTPAEKEVVAADETPKPTTEQKKEDKPERGQQVPTVENPIVVRSLGYVAAPPGTIRGGYISADLDVHESLAADICGKNAFENSFRVTLTIAKLELHGCGVAYYIVDSKTSIAIQFRPTYDGKFVDAAPMTFTESERTHGKDKLSERFKLIRHMHQLFQLLRFAASHIATSRGPS